MSFLGLASPLNSIEYKGKTYYISALTFKEMAEYVLWYQYLELEKQEIVTRNLPPELREEILRDTHKACKYKVWKYTDEKGAEKEAPLSWETPEIQDSCNTLEGIQQQIYLAIRIKHPEVTKELIGEIVTLENYNYHLNKLLTAMGWTPELKDETKEIYDSLKKVTPNCRKKKPIRKTKSR
jgi:hypothetical protein